MTTTSLENDLWIRRFHPVDQPKVRLVCFPHAGGSATFYFPVSAALAGDAEVLAVQYPGRQDRHAEAPIDSITGLADELAPALRQWTDRPFAFFGHSMGALVAFETALRLQAGGVRPTMLFASGRRAPSRVRDENVHQRDDDGIIREMKALSGTDSRILADEELLRMVLPAIRGDYKAVETYRCPPGAKVDAPITVLTGDDDPKTTLDEANDWTGHSTGDVDVRVFAGGHFFLTNHQPEINGLLAEHARACREW